MRANIAIVKPNERESARLLSSTAAIGTQKTTAIAAKRQYTVFFQRCKFMELLLMQIQDTKVWEIRLKILLLTVCQYFAVPVTVTA